MSELSPRVEEAAKLLARGLSVGEIAEKMGIAPVTVKVHLRRARQKLGLRDSINLVIWVKDNLS